MESNSSFIHFIGLPNLRRDIEINVIVMSFIDNGEQWKHYYVMT